MFHLWRTRWVLPYMALSYIILVLTGVSFAVALVRIVIVLRNRGRAFTRYTYTPNGIRRRLDFDLIEDISVNLVTFAGYIFLALNFAGYIILGVWAFGPLVARASLIVIIALTFLQALKRLYKFVEDACEN